MSQILSFKRLQTSPATPLWVLAFFAFSAVVVRLSPAGAWSSGFTTNYLSLHIILEFIGILVSFGIANVGWVTFRNTRDFSILILSIASVAVGALDLGHTLAFPGMPAFFGASDSNRTITFWLVSRALGSSAYLYVALSHNQETYRKGLRWILLTSAVLLVALTYDLVLFHDELLPVFFIQGVGLTTLKITCEWSCVGLSLVACILLFRRGVFSENVNVRWMGCACGLYSVCGYFFTIYHDMNDLYVFAGHCYKALSALFLYRAVFAESVSQPYERVETLAQEASAANLTKSRFLASVSHEFRTPVGVIIGFSEMLSASPRLDQTEKGWSNTVLRNAAQLGRLIEDLLDIAKAEYSKTTFHPAKFDLAVAITQVLEALEPQARAKKLELKLLNELNGSQICSDEVRVKQILVNLVSNAIKFTNRGSITVTANNLTDGSFAILVRDTGIGISANDRPALFRPFSQVGDASKRTYAGTGLGLSVSRTLAEVLAGRLELTQSQIGDGSEFRLTLVDHEPRAAIENSTAENPIAKTIAPDLLNKRILIAEDSIDNQNLLKVYLAPTKASLSFANNGREALDLQAQNQFDLILMDIQMPEMDGFEATLSLRSRGWRGPIVALTAHALQPERERAVRNGFDNYLVKPINKTILWNALESHLKGSHV